MGEANRHAPTRASIRATASMPGSVHTSTRAMDTSPSPQGSSGWAVGRAVGSRLSITHDASATAAHIPPRHSLGQERDGAGRDRASHAPVSNARRAG